MNNGILFFNSFLSYALLFVISVVVMLIGGFIGVKIRKAKDAQKAANNDQGEAGAE